MDKIKVIIVDDHKIVRDGIISFTFGHEIIEVIGEAGSGEEILQLLERKHPDVIVMDIALPGKNGIELTEYITKNYPAINILMLSAIDDEDSILASVEAGAKGFLHKECEEKEFLFAIQKIYIGEHYFGERISSIIQAGLVKKVNTSDVIQGESLTKREIEVIKCMADGCSDKQIAESLFISIRTVETHKKHIREKLNLNSTAELVKYAIKNNIINL